VQGAECRVQGAGRRAQGAGRRAQGAGRRAQGAGRRAGHWCFLLSRAAGTLRRTCMGPRKPAEILRRDGGTPAMERR